MCLLDKNYSKFIQKHDSKLEKKLFAYEDEFYYNVNWKKE